MDGLMDVYIVFHHVHQSHENIVTVNKCTCVFKT